MHTVDRTTNLTAPASQPLTVATLPALTDAQIKTKGWAAAGSVAVPALAAGMATTAAIIVGRHGAPFVQKLLEGTPVDTTDGVMAGLAGAGAAFFGYQTAALLLKAGRAIAMLSPNGNVKGLDPAQQKVVNDFVADEVSRLNQLRGFAFLTVPIVALAATPPFEILSPLCAGTAAFLTLLSASRVAKSHSEGLTVLRDNLPAWTEAQQQADKDARPAA